MMHIRKATIDDAPASFAVRRAAILAQCGDHYPMEDLVTWTSGAMSTAFAQRVAGHFHVAVVENEVVGTGMLDLTTAKIDAIFVLPGYMGQGVGRALMDHLEAIARDAGLAQIELEATLNAAPFYRKLGFEGDGRSVYHSSLGVSLACVPMSKRLGC